MERLIPKEKLGKKARRERSKAQRGTWGTLNPVTRVVKNKKIYDRKKARAERSDFFSDGPSAFWDSVLCRFLFKISGPSGKKGIAPVFL